MVFEQLTPCTCIGHFHQSVVIPTLLSPPRCGNEARTGLDDARLCKGTRTGKSLINFWDSDPGSFFAFSPHLPLLPTSIPSHPDMTSPASPTDSSLPQYGFGAEVAFDALIDTNPFLFRVYTPKQSASTCCSTSDDPDAPFFLAQQFQSDPLAPLSKPSPASYADVAQHMDWTKKSTSPFVSSSFSFAWALWEAVRRYHGNMKHDVEIAVIDARLVADRAVTAVELLRKSKTKE